MIQMSSMVRDVMREVITKMLLEIKRGMTVRALSSDNKLSSNYSQAGVGANPTNKVWNDSFTKMFQYLVSGPGSISNSKKMSIADFDMNAAANTVSQALSRINESKMWGLSAAEYATKQENNTDKYALLLLVQEKVRALYTETGILDVTAFSLGVTKSASNPENAVLVTRYMESQVTSMFSQLWSKYFTDFAISATDGGITMGGKTDANMRSLVEMMNLVRCSKINSSGAVQDLSFKTIRTLMTTPAASRVAEHETIHELYSLIQMFTVMGSMDAVSATLAKTFDGDGTKVSDEKAVNTLFIEVARVRELFAIQVFLGMSAYINMLQMAMFPYCTDAMIAHFELLNPEIASAYDIRTLINDFMALPTASLPNEMIGTFSYRTGLVFGGTQMTCLDASVNVKPTDLFTYVRDELAEFIKYLHYFSKNVELLEAYREGGAICGVSKLQLAGITFDPKAIPVYESQWGALNGPGPRFFHDMFLSMHTEYGVSAYNGSSANLFTMGSQLQDNRFKPYSTALFSYQSIINDVEEFIDDVISNKKGYVTGTRIRKLNVPAYFVTQRVMDNAYMYSLLERRFMAYGSASLLPRQFKTAPLIFGQKAAIVTSRKAITGKYSIEIEKMALTYLDVDDSKTDLASSMDIERLALALGINAESLLISASANNPVTSRFFTFGGKNGDNLRLISGALVSDPFFEEIPRGFFLIPAEPVMTFATVVMKDMPLVFNGGSTNDLEKVIVEYVDMIALRARSASAISIAEPVLPGSFGSVDNLFSRGIKSDSKNF